MHAQADCRSSRIASTIIHFQFITFSHKAFAWCYVIISIMTNHVLTVFAFYFTNCQTHVNCLHKKVSKKRYFHFSEQYNVNQYIHGFNIFTIIKFMVYNVYIYMYNVGGIGIKLKKRVSFKQIMTMLFIKE